MLSKLIFLVLITSQILINIFEHSTPSEMYLHLLNVGQGDSILLKTIDRKYILIDGGPNSNVIDEMADFLPFWETRLDYVIATHGDADHIGGLVEVFERYRVDNFIYNGEEKQTLMFNQLLENVKKNNNKIIRAEAGQHIQVGCCSLLEILWPNKNPPQDSNDKSVAMIFKYKDFDIYLAGDLGYEIEEEITTGLEKSIEVMKLSHHGSRTSTSEKTLTNISPEIGLISLGRNNKFGHPHEEVTNLLKEHNINILRTDLHGTISISSDGSSGRMKIKKGNI